MNKGVRDMILCWLVMGALLVILFLWEASWQTPDYVRHYDEEPYIATSTSFPVETPTEFPTEAPTEAPTATNKPMPTNTPLPTNTPTEEAPRASQGIVGTKKCEVNGMHSWKPWAWYTAITVVNSPQYRLQQIAKTDEKGIRIVLDPNGEWRYCVALPVYWAGGTSKDIGRCFDLIMENGHTLKCVLGDTKKIEHSLRGEGKYGRKGEIIEVQCDGSKIPDIVRKMGNASYFGEEWMGEVSEVRVLNFFIKGFGKE